MENFVLSQAENMTEISAARLTRLMKHLKPLQSYDRVPITANATCGIVAFTSN